MGKTNEKFCSEKQKTLKRCKHSLWKEQTPFKKGLIVKAEEIQDRTAAEGVEHLEFFVEEDLFVSKPGETIFLTEIKNFKLKDAEQNVLGEIVGFSSNGVQDLLVVKSQGAKKWKFRLSMLYIKKIDFKHQAVVMDLPEGLFDIENA